MGVFCQIHINRMSCSDMDTTRLSSVLLAVTSLLLAMDIHIAEARPQEAGDGDVRLFEDLKALLRATKSRPASCTAEYQAMPSHTMCIYDDSPNASNRGVSRAAQQEIVNQHNKHRSSVSPPATDMVKMYWDENIAKIAQHYANSCPTYHEANRDSRKVPGYGISIGQNIGYYYQPVKSWTQNIDSWHSEVKDFTYGASYQQSGIGHYTQVVHNDAIAIGCGYAKCKGTFNWPFAHTYVCNYAYGQLGSTMNTPYTSGSSCSACPGKCSNKLCDCGNTVCYNGNTLNLRTCTCSGASGGRPSGGTSVSTSGGSSNGNRPSPAPSGGASGGESGGASDGTSGGSSSGSSPPVYTGASSCLNYYSGVNSGTILSPAVSKTDSRYPNDANCKYDITVASGSKIKLHFVQFATESGYDTLVMRDDSGTSRVVSGSYSTGGGPPSDITFNSNHVTLTFTSDSSTNDSGFTIEFQTIAGSPSGGSCVDASFCSMYGSSICSGYWGDQCPKKCGKC